MCRHAGCPHLLRDQLDDTRYYFGKNKGKEQTGKLQALPSSQIVNVYRVAWRELK